MIKTYTHGTATLQDISGDEERKLTFSITAPISAWREAKQHLGEATGKDFYLYSVLRDALDNV